MLQDIFPQQLDFPSRNRKTYARPLPLYKQIVAHIEQAIENGVLCGGERLPSERTLGALLRVNRSTVVQALNDLTDRGILLRRLGSGTYVNKEKWGLRQYPLLNWRSPALAGADPAAAAQARLVAAYRTKARQKGGRLDDCSGSDLAADLLPALATPAQAWREVLSREVDSEGALTGLASFKEAVQQHLRVNIGLTVDQEQILITSGTRQSLFLISQCLLKPGDAVGIEAPSYFYSLPLFQAAGLRLFALPIDRDGVILDGLDALVARRGIRMLFLNPVFQNPTGHLMSKTRKEEIARYCEARRLPIVEDDAYSLLSFSTGADFAPIKRLGSGEQVIYIGSLSSYMGGGVRAGWLVAPQGIVRKLGEVRLHMDAGLSVLPQLLAESYLRRTCPDHSLFLRPRLARRAAALRDRIAAELSGRFSCFPPQGGLYLYLYARKQWEKEGLTLLEDLLRRGLVPALGLGFGDSAANFCLNFSGIKDS
ncbi:MAG: PLP-dependent aminotransferase family protein [Desulfovibrio sp.]|nr:PLP-dependent aminotransferase family protein [Desulfovibrio sp.]